MLQPEPGGAVGLQTNGFCALNALQLQRAGCSLQGNTVGGKTWLRRQFQRQDVGTVELFL